MSEIRLRTIYNKFPFYFCIQNTKLKNYLLSAIHVTRTIRNKRPQNNSIHFRIKNFSMKNEYIIVSDTIFVYKFSSDLSYDFFVGTNILYSATCSLLNIIKMLLSCSYDGFTKSFWT